MTPSFFYISFWMHPVLYLFFDTPRLVYAKLTLNLVFVERELADLPGTLAADTLPKFFNDFTRVAHLNI
jgi:hypothetical protein